MKALFVISSIGRGHVARSRPLIRALQARGVVCEAVALSRRLVPLLSDLCPVHIPAQLIPSAKQAMRASFIAIPSFAGSIAIYSGDDQAAAAVLHFLTAILREVRPDVVVVDQVVYTGHIARALSIPVVQLTHGPYFPGRRSWGPPQPVGLSEKVRAHLRRLFRGEGLPAPVHEDDLLQGQAYISPTPPLLGTAQHALHYAAPADLPALQPWHPSAIDRPRVAVSFGTTPDRTPDVVAAVLAAGAVPVVLDDRSVRGSTDGLVRAGAEVVGLVDAEAALRHVAALVYSGGAGLTVDALRVGVPTVVVPATQEMLLNGLALAALEAGEVVPVSPEPLAPLELVPGVEVMAHREPLDLESRVAAAVRRALDPSAVRAASTARAVLDSLPSVDSAADLVVALK